MPTFQQFLDDTIENLAIKPIPLDEPLSLSDLPTPALILDLDQFEANMVKMQKHLDDCGIGLRCHTKMHKSPICAKKQIDQGAIGVCCATVSEAEVMLASGIDEILITSPVVTQDKISRVMVLAKKSQDLQIVVDYIGGAKSMDSAAKATGLKLNVLIDLDPGMGCLLYTSPSPRDS